MLLIRIRRSSCNLAVARAVFANSLILANQRPILCVSVSVVQIPCAAELFKLIGSLAFAGVSPAKIP